ncbi:MAG: hypothetical protein RIQ54_144 [Candidatus Parcubacteria bacterium]
MAERERSEWVSWQRSKNGSAVFGEYQRKTENSYLRFAFVLRWKKRKVYVSIAATECQNNRSQCARIVIKIHDKHSRITNQTMWSYLWLIAGVSSCAKKKKIVRLLRKKYFNIDSFCMRKNMNR